MPTGTNKNAVQRSVRASWDGGLEVVLSPAARGSSAAVLNAADAGSFTRKVYLTLVDVNGNVQEWFNGTLAITPTEVVTDADVAAPTPDANPVQLAQGQGVVELTYDTDAGATKTYAADDTVGFSVDAVDLHGNAVDVTAVYLDTLVA